MWDADDRTRLIMVEGLPGMGKSTTAAWIAKRLKARGEKVLCVDEGAGEHPADYADYDFPDFETERRMILGKWRSFAAQADPDTVYVFNCLFLQNPMCETMMRFGMDWEDSRRYVAEIVEIVRPMKPVIVYLSEPDIRGIVDSVLEERGPEWLNGVIEYHTAQGYGKAKGLKGYEGYLACLEERKRRELLILEAIDVASHIIGRDEAAAWVSNLGREREEEGV